MLAAAPRRSLASNLGSSRAGASASMLGLRRSMTMTGSSSTLRSLAPSLAGDSPTAAPCPFTALFPEVVQVSLASAASLEGQCVGVGERGQLGAGAGPGSPRAQAQAPGQALLFGDVELPPEAWKGGEGEGEGPGEKEGEPAAPPARQAGWELAAEGSRPPAAAEPAAAAAAAAEGIAGPGLDSGSSSPVRCELAGEGHVGSMSLRHLLQRLPEERGKQGGWLG